ncbi:hypothetical protein DH2020_030119 [Rehmannia glutinosa]|uniref:SEC12-like protein n=1 Tax=Rehmannia glutinosa TaxID=99300 RepID=A0ABR0VLR2_REHGL
MDGGDAPGQGTVTCATWNRRPENAHLVVVGKSGPPSLEIFSFDPNTISLSASPKAKYEFEEGVNPLIIAVHPSGDELVCSTSTGDCKLFEVYGREDKIKLTAKEQLPLQGIGLQKCIAFSVDGTRFATGGVQFSEAIMLILYSMNFVHRLIHFYMILFYNDIALSILDNDILQLKKHCMLALLYFLIMLAVCLDLDSEFLASTSTDGSARIWNTSDGAPVTTLTRNSDEKIGLCRFSKDGTKPFLFCSVQRGNKPLTVVWDISTWKKVGHKRLLNKPASIMSVSLDGKYLALGSKDGDICVVEVKNMEVRHRSKRLHLGSDIASLGFCPSERYEWQIYLLLLGLFVASLVAFYIFFENSDSFWNFPLAKNQAARPDIETILGDSHSDQNMWEPLDL